jgi:hypothetical protein
MGDKLPAQSLSLVDPVEATPNEVALRGHPETPRPRFHSNEELPIPPHVDPSHFWGTEPGNAEGTQAEKSP